MTRSGGSSPGASFPRCQLRRCLGTFVFCSVPDPMLGLSQLRRVLAPGGYLLLLEHVLSHKPLLDTMMRLLNPLTVRTSRANIDRETVENICRAGFVDLLGGGAVAGHREADRAPGIGHRRPV